MLPVGSFDCLPSFGIWKTLLRREEGRDGLLSSLPSFDELEVFLFRETIFSTSLPLNWSFRLLELPDFVVCVCVSYILKMTTIILCSVVPRPLPVLNIMLG